VTSRPPHANYPESGLRIRLSSLFNYIPMSALLPPELTQGAILRDQEYAWELSDFPQALQRAPSPGYACLARLPLFAAYFSKDPIFLTRS
jgi:hypothetical protein